MTTEQATPAVADESSAFAAGFNEQRGIPTTEPEVAPAAEKPATEAPAPDEWAGVAPKVKAEFENLSKKLGAVDKVSERLRNFEGVLGGVAQQTKEIRAALEQSRTAAAAQGSATPTQQQVEHAVANPERMKRLKEDFPDWAEAFEEELGALRAAIPKSVPSADAIKAELNAEFDKRLTQARKDAALEARVLGQIDRVHEGWEETVNTPEFDAWIATQPQDIQNLAASPKAADAIRMLNLFKADQQKGADKGEREARLKRAATPKGVVVQTQQEDADEAFAAGFNGVRRPVG